MTCSPVTMTRYRRHLTYLLGSPVPIELSPRRVSRTGRRLPMVSP
jgi:hypothetical protein